ncbi:hypothetical protein A1O3_05701 [Capronia epimyces CBS 606.96]|uniref:ADA HAT complex component 1 n=1 Tax=Capronia epimyces CBS 606.96 TaxID=1182542 RepID=W9Y713_9EURO|nr:uncharacterized protein A1O3_05701 [Capronia epimyces CBS 606.96]EXJ85026.1 hypothetical protein A1O3_05701 [Capronia epimyces CBS 606.96]
MASLPSPASLSADAVQQALNLYPALVEKAYRGKLKDSKKVADALERDQWRYEDLPAAIASMKPGGENEAKQPSSHADIVHGALTKNAVERLVQWKITHGHSRPFLPAMVRKNEPTAVQTQTKLAWEKLQAPNTTAPPSTSTVTAALDLVCKLTGIGPATGTLILNVYDPVNIPFFQDEMFAWFFPATKGDKLKYTQKEYLQLLEVAQHALKKLGLKAVELEKISYVLGHMELLLPTERKPLEDALMGIETKPLSEEGKQAAVLEDKEISSIQAEKRMSTKTGLKRASSKLEVDNSREPPPPKRRSQRIK